MRAFDETRICQKSKLRYFGIVTVCWCDVFLLTFLMSLSAATQMWVCYESFLKLSFKSSFADLY